ncbi:hypothetical protein CPB84DRAFT_443252 [Gymnopilus junonius]|uniref:Uncharacterized protein n=1 Tax=Gymnopilus junonius TaxID=109634 RepID=A0A9P5NBV6_GYMJU|nr:hypothetical protein CPB84DRAFT_443252 [Gymnopilus junonius]
MTVENNEILSSSWAAASGSGSGSGFAPAPPTGPRALREFNAPTTTGAAPSASTSTPLPRTPVTPAYQPLQAPRLPGFEPASSSTSTSALAPPPPPPPGPPPIEPPTPLPEIPESLTYETKPASLNGGDGGVKEEMGQEAKMALWDERTRWVVFFFLGLDWIGFGSFFFFDVSIPLVSVFVGSCFRFYFFFRSHFFPVSFFVSVFLFLSPFGLLASVCSVQRVQLEVGSVATVSFSLFDYFRLWQEPEWLVIFSCYIFHLLFYPTPADSSPFLSSWTSTESSQTPSKPAKN